MAGADIVDFAVAGDGTIVYAGIGTANELYKSTNGGATWTKIDMTAAIGTIDLIAVAPDNPDVVVWIDNLGGADKVFASTNGGTTFEELTNSDVTNIRALDVSTAAAGINYICVGGDDGVAAPGNAIKIANFDLGDSVPKWTAMEGWATMDGSNSVAAVKFSSNFSSNKVMVAVTETDTAGNDEVYYEISGYSARKWNYTAGWPTYNGVNNKILSGVANGVPLQSASISLLPDYLFNDPLKRIGFVGMATNAACATEGGIYRMNDETATGLKTNTNIHSVAYKEDDLLVAGDYDANIVYRSANPLASVNWSIYSTSVYQRPSSVAATVRTKVAWAGDNVVAGTSGNESAFSVSKDSGVTFNDISLIDTELTILDDIAVAADGSKLYLTSRDESNDLSVWRQASSWERVLNIPSIGDKTHSIRVARNDPNTVYVFQQGVTTPIYYTSDGAEYKWHLRSCFNCPVQDLAVESTDVAYAFSSAGEVSKTIDGGFIWRAIEGTGLNSGSTIVSLGEGKIIAGSQDGRVAYSTDGNSSWTAITPQIEADALLTHVTASGLADDDYIYAASTKAGTKVMRWQIGTSAIWEDMNAGIAAGYAGYGIALWGKSELSVLTSDGVDSTLLITPVVEASTINWTSVPSLGTSFITMPSALRISSSSIKRWAIDTTQASLYSNTMQPLLVTDITVTAQLQGDYRTLEGYNVPLSLKLYDQPVSTSNIISIPPIYILTSSGGDISIIDKNTSTGTITLNVSEAPAGIFNITLYTPHCLINLKNGVNIPAQGTQINMGTLMEGDAEDITENSKTIDSTDFQRFALAYETVSGDTDWNELVDFNRDGTVNIQDFSFLYTNYGETSPQVVE
ncbi:MAG: hypothetical protein ABH839_01980 [Chloroflexota bacterium]